MCLCPLGRHEGRAHHQKESTFSRLSLPTGIKGLCEAFLPFLPGEDTGQSLFLSASLPLLPFSSCCPHRWHASLTLRAAQVHCASVSLGRHKVLPRIRSGAPPDSPFFSLILATLRALLPTSRRNWCSYPLFHGLLLNTQSGTHFTVFLFSWKYAEHRQVDPD